MYNNLWYQFLNKSPLTPSGIVFSTVWPMLYVLMAISVYLYINKEGEKKEKRFALLIFGTQLLLNILWSPIFFIVHNVYLAFLIVLVLIILVLWTIILFYQNSKSSAYLLIPYFLWLYHIKAF